MPGIWEGRAEKGFINISRQQLSTDGHSISVKQIILPRAQTR